MSMTCIIFTALNLSQGQSADKNHRHSSWIGVDMTAGMCFKTIRLMAGHKFMCDWSAEFEVALDMASVEKKTSDTELDHRENLTEGYSAVRTEDKFRLPFQELCIHLDYWTTHAFQGLHICIGGILKDRGEPDFLLGAGYSIHIWKGLSMDIMYRFGIIETYESRQLPLKGIKTGLYYAF